MCLEYDGSQNKDVPSSFELPWLNLDCYIYVVEVAFTRLWLDNLKSRYIGLLMFWNTFMVIIKIIALIGTWRTTQENSATTILYGSDLG
jgi:hypothetical protein